MHHSLWLRALARVFLTHGRVSSRKRDRKIRHVPLHVEALEDRVTPSSTIVVNDASGGMDNAANVTVSGLGSKVTLIDAINAANNSGGSGSYVIDLSHLPANSTLTFTQALNNTTITSNNVVQDQNWYGPDALPAITSNITIQGSGDTLAISGTNMRFFYVSGGPTFTGGALTAGSLTLDNLTLEGGVAQGGSGSGGGLGAGGAIFNQGNLTLNGATLTNNQAIGGAGTFGGGGGGMGPTATPGNLAGGGFGGNFSITGGPTGGSGSIYGNAGGGAGFLSTANGSNAGTSQAGAGGGLGDFGGMGGGATGSAAGDGGGGGNGTFSGGAGGGFGGGGLGGSGGNGSGGGGGGVGGGGGGTVYATLATTGSGGGGGFGGGGAAGLDGGGGGFGGGGGSASITNHGSTGKGGFGGGTGGGGGAGMGGGIFNMFGTLTITNSTLSSNTAQGGGSGGAMGGNLTAGSGFGGALFNLDGNATLTGVNLTSNNAVVPSGSVIALANGSAVYNFAYGNTVTTGGPTTATMILKNSTIVAGTGSNALVNDLGNGKNTNTAVFYTYDAQGRLTGILYPNGNVYARTYNSNGSTATLTNPATGTIASGVASEDFTYNSSGQLTQLVLNYTNGNVLTYNYTNGVLSSASLTNPTTGKISSSVASEDFTYDTSGKLSQLVVSYTSGNVLTYNYTNGVLASATLTNPTTGTVASGVTSEDFTYTSGKLTQLVVNYTNGNVLTYNYTNGVLSSASLTNPTTGKISSSVTSEDFTYDTSGKLSQLVVSYTSGNVLTYNYTNGVLASASLTNPTTGTVASGVTSEDFTYSSGKLSQEVVNYTNGNVFTHTWDSDGDGTSYATLANSSGTVLEYYEYNAQGSLTYGSSTKPSPWPPT